MSIKLFEVGGCVRDSILGVPSKDIDFAVEAPSFNKMKEEMENRGFKIFQESPEFLTIRARFPDKNLVADFVLCRKESGFSNARHPDKVEPGTIFDDLARRDFTVNAIARCVETGIILDPHNGRVDLENKILRSVGDPVERFSEDGLRILRALRFSISKSLQIHPTLWDAIQNAEPNLLGNVSSDRKREELNKMFKVDTLKALQMIAELPVDLQKSLFQDNVIWLKATTEKQK